MRPLRALLLVAGVALAALTLAVAQGRGPGTTYAGATPVAGAATAAMIFALAAAGATGRGWWPGAAAALAVTLPVWAGTAPWPALQSAAEALTPIAVALVPAVGERTPRRLLAAAAAATAALVAVRLLLRDPLYDLHCFADCVTSPFVVHRAAGVAHAADLIAGPVLALLALAAAIHARARLRDAAGPALIAAGLGLHATALAVDPQEAAARPALQLAYCLVAAGAATIGAVTAADAGGALLAQRAVLRLASDLRADATRANIELALQRIAHDPTLALLPAGGDTPPPGHVLTVRAAGREVAQIAHRPGAARGLERALGPSVRLSLANAMLRERLEQRVARRRETRERVVTLGDAARRSLERDLHDGAQQGVLAVLFELRLQTARAADTPLAAHLDAAADEAAAALEELRELAHGIHPAILTDAGLPPALRSLTAGRAHLAATPPGRYPPVTEATVYRVVDEAVHNAATHADPQRIVVSVVEHPRALVATIQDDGIGGARPDSSGGGLAELSDRVGMCGGSLTLTSDPGRGTIVEAVIPCA